MSFSHRRAAIVSIGDELVLGQNLDTNSKWLSDRLMQFGITSVEHVTVSDDLAQTAGAFARLATSADLIISTGGLGPTLDDLTRQALAQLLGEELILDHTALEALKARFEARGRKMSDVQKIQACRPASARMIPNAWGTAPGLRATIKVSEKEADVFCLPGPPGEMKPMFETHVASSLRPDSSRRVVTRFVHLTGIGEGDAGVKLGDLMDRSRNPLVGITVAGSVMTCRVRYEGELGADEAAALVEKTAAGIRSRLGDYVFGEGNDTLAGVIVREMKSRGRTLTTVESCTGGLLAGAITDVPGSSAAFVGGFLTYSNELKEKLAGVSRDDLRAHGAVSEQVARAMAVGGLERTGATNCLAVTGIAGPDGGTPEKPVGTVYIAHAWRGDRDAVEFDVRKFFTPGTREEVRRRSVFAALQMVRLWLADRRGQKLLWEAAG
jgi:nicotinamide-nucleotide amidase